MCIRDSPRNMFQTVLILEMYFLWDNLLTAPGRAKTWKMTFRDARKNTLYFVPPHRETCPLDVEGTKIRYIWTRNASPAIPNHVIHPGSANTKTRQGKKYLHFKVTWRTRRYNNLKACMSDQWKMKILILKNKNKILQWFLCVHVGGLVLRWSTLKRVCNSLGKQACLQLQIKKIK